jgi:hypothetical protein
MRLIPETEMCTARLKLCAEAWRVKQAVSDGDLPPTPSRQIEADR